MAFFLSPILNEQQFDANGDPRSGALITTYLAGTLTAVTTYKTNTGTAHSNPIQLDSSGNYPNGTQLWLLGGLTYKFVITDSDGANSRTYDNITGIGDNASTASQWVLYSATPTYISPTSFSLVGDQTNIFQQKRKIESINSGGTVYSTVASAVFLAGITTVTVTNTSGVLDSGLSQVSYGLLTSINDAIPTTIARAGANSDITSLSGLTNGIVGTSGDQTIAGVKTFSSMPVIPFDALTASLGADVNLTNTANYFDGPSIAQGTTGTWWVSGSVVVVDSNAGGGNIHFKLWDGATVISSGYVVLGLSAGIGNQLEQIELSGFIANPAGNLRISVRNASNTANTSIKFNQSGNSKDSTISAFRLS